MVSILRLPGAMVDRLAFCFWQSYGLRQRLPLGRQSGRLGMQSSIKLTLPSSYSHGLDNWSIFIASTYMVRDKEAFGRVSKTKVFRGVLKITPGASCDIATGAILLEA
jgi:hypothetical protein